MISRDARSLAVVAVLVVVIIGVTITWMGRTSPGPGWIKVGSVADVQRQGVTKVADRAYVVSYADLPPYAFVAAYDEASEGIHENVYFCPSSGWFFNEPHATQYDIVGKYKLGPAPSSTLPRVAVTVLDGTVWVNPSQPVAGLVPGAEGVDQKADGPYCQTPQEAL